MSRTWLIGLVATTLACSSIAAAVWIGTRESLKSAAELGRARAGAFLHRLGVTPEAMAAANLSSEEVDRVLAASEAVVASRNMMDTIDEANRAAHAADNAAVEGPGRDGGTQETPAQARAALQAELDRAFDLITATVAVERVATLRQIRQNAARRLPVPFLTVDREPQAWLALRSALAVKRIAERDRVTVPQREAQLIAEAEAAAPVSQAKALLTANLERVRGRWVSMLGSY